MTIRLLGLATGVFVLCHAETPFYRTAAQGDPGLMQPGPSAVSADGAYVAFESFVSLLPVDSNHSVSDIYVLDVSSGRVELASISQGGTASNGSSSSPRLSGDARYVVFESVASNLVSEQMPNCPTIVLRDRRDGTTRAIVRAHAEPARVLCGRAPAISEDGRFIAFTSTAVDLVDGVDANGPGYDVYMTDTIGGATTRISVDDQGRQHSIGISFGAAISADGAYVAFTSTACLDGAPAARTSNNPSGTCARRIYVRDRRDGRTRPVLGLRQSRPDGQSYDAAISADGRYVAFTSTATNIVRQRSGNVSQVYLYDMHTGESELVSRTSSGRPGNGPSAMPAVAGSGRFVAFHSVASDLTCLRCPKGEQDQNLVSDVFVLDRESARVQRLSRGPGAEVWWSSSVGPAVDALGRVFAFSSRHPIGPADDGADYDLFVLRH